MPRQHGPWMVKATTLTYHNAFIEVREDRVTQPDGQPGVCATVTMRPGVAVLPVDDDGRVYLVHQFRYALGRESLEVVSGALEAGESALAAASGSCAKNSASPPAPGWTSGGWIWTRRSSTAPSSYIWRSA